MRSCALMLVPVVAFACARAPAPSDVVAPGVVAPEVAAPGVVAPPEGPLVQALRRAASACDVGLVGELEGCDDSVITGELEALELQGVAAAMASECRLLTDDDIEVGRLSMARMKGLNHRIEGGPGAVGIDRDTVECLRGAVLAPEAIDRFGLIDVFASAALAAGQDETMAATVLGLRGADERLIAYTALGKFGGPRVLAVVERIVAAEPDPELRGQALRALGARDFPASGPDHDAGCGAFAKYAEDPADAVNERALDGLGAFCPEHYPRMVAVITARQASRTLTTRQLRGLVSLAGGFKASAARQAEAAELLAGLVVDRGLAGETRTSALEGVARHDPKRARALAAKLRGDPDPVVVAAAAALLTGGP